MDQTFEIIKPKTYGMIYDLAKETFFDHDLSKAKKALESVLQTFASRLDIDQGIIVISNLPSHLKSHFSKGWTPFSESNLPPSNNFAPELKSKYGSFFNSFNMDQIKKIIKSVFLLLCKYIMPERMQRIESCFDNELKNILNS
jgi:uncharacterized protein (DUF2267 family)